MSKRYKNTVNKTHSLDENTQDITLSLEQIGEIKKAFTAIDEDHDGTISNIEMTKLLKQRYKEYDDETIANMVKAADNDGDGQVNFDEFCEQFKGKIQKVLCRHETIINDIYTRPDINPKKTKVGENDFKDPYIFKRMHYYNKKI